MTEKTNVLHENTSNDETDVLQKETSVVTNKETLEGIHEKFRGNKTSLPFDN
jgi:hypothetical protein